MGTRKRAILGAQIEHIDIKSFNSIPLIESFSRMAFQARNLARASVIYDNMLSDLNCTVILCLSGSVFSAGLKKAVYDLIMNNMIDVIVSSGAIMVDQDFFEALGFRHYEGTPCADDGELRRNGIDRIYDTFINEEELRICDMTVKEIADRMPPRPYSSREFLGAMGAYIASEKRETDSVVAVAYEKGVPIFVPAFSDCSAGFGLLLHQWTRGDGNLRSSIDSVKDFYELARVKMAAKNTGLLMVGGGVPKNFAQDVVVAGRMLGKNVPMHKYAVQITVADERDGALSGSTLREAHSWGKVGQKSEQMVFAEATLAFPLICSYAYHKRNWRIRKPRRYSAMLDGQS